MNRWQKKDQSNNLIYPWYTFEALDEISKWDTKDWNIFEYGGGYSTLWWREEAKNVITIDNNKNWCEKMNLIHINSYKEYIEYPKMYKDKYDQSFDCIIIDGEPTKWRDSCIEYALKSIKIGGKIIIDNYMQNSIPDLSENKWTKTNKIISDENLNFKIYKTPGHIDWKTIIIDI